MTKSPKQSPAVDQILELLEQLSSDERERILRLLETDIFQKEIQNGIDAAEGLRIASTVCDGNSDVVRPCAESFVA